MVKLDSNQYVFAGSHSWRIFMPIIPLEDKAFVIHSGGEGKQLRPCESIHYEQIVLSRTSGWQDVLASFGSVIAEKNGIEKLKEVDFKGWATWDYYAYEFSADDIYENVEKIKELAPSARTGISFIPQKSSHASTFRFYPMSAGYKHQEANCHRAYGMYSYCNLHCVPPYQACHTK